VLLTITAVGGPIDPSEHVVSKRFYGWGATERVDMSGLHWGTCYEAEYVFTIEDELGGPDCHVSTVGCTDFP
jgi:hypothetical protein